MANQNGVYSARTNPIKRAQTPPRFPSERMGVDVVSIAKERLCFLLSTLPRVSALEEVNAALHSPIL